MEFRFHILHSTALLNYALEPIFVVFQEFDEIKDSSSDTALYYIN